MNDVKLNFPKKKLIPTVDSWSGDVNFFRLYGAQTKFLVPGDVWREKVDCFIRLMPMLSPPLTRMFAKIRHWVVPLRLVEPELTEEIVTGSNDGVLSNVNEKHFVSIFENIILDDNNEFTVNKNSILHIVFGVPAKKFDDSVIDEASAPRLYWLKGYCRLWWDYYRDENIGIHITTISDSGEEIFTSECTFEEFVDFVSAHAHDMRCLPIMLPKNYYFGCLPWQMKGSAPQITFQSDASLHWLDISSDDAPATNLGSVTGINSIYDAVGKHGLGASGNIDVDKINDNVQAFLDNIDVELSKVGFDASKLRDMLAQTRILERLAKTGSRYTEYLRGNFGISPSDGTLQRAVYLGGFKQDILTTEVLQNGPGDTPVGTMRGHGVSNARNNMNPYVAKEFSLMFTTFEIQPEVTLTQGISRELTYKSRWEFYNPLFAHLSEQEVRKGEIFFASDTENDETFGFRDIYDEFRTGRRRFFGELGASGSLSYWNQAIQYSLRPDLNGYYIDGTSYSKDWLRPWGLLNEDAGNPIIVDLYCQNFPMRPIPKEGMPK